MEGQRHRLHRHRRPSADDEADLAVVIDLDVSRKEVGEGENEEGDDE